MLQYEIYYGEQGDKNDRNTETFSRKAFIYSTEHDIDKFDIKFYSLFIMQYINKCHNALKHARQGR